MSDDPLPYGTYRNTKPLRHSISQEITLSQEEADDLSQLSNRSKKRKPGSNRLGSSTKRLKKDTSLSVMDEEDLDFSAPKAAKKTTQKIFDPDVASIYSIIQHFDDDESDFLDSPNRDSRAKPASSTDPTVLQALWAAQKARNNVRNLAQSVTRANSAVFDLVEEPQMQVDPSSDDDDFQFQIVTPQRVTTPASTNLESSGSDPKNETKEAQDDIGDPDIVAYLKELDAKVALQSSVETPTEEKIKVGVKFNQTEKKFYRLNKNDPFSKLIDKVKEKLAAELAPGAKIKLMFDGAALDPSETPADQDMEDEDLVDVKIVP